MKDIIIGNYSLYQILLYFFVYSFLGWCTEVAYATYRTNKVVNRGFLNGPVCPIYGFGVVIVLICLTPFKENPFLLFICSVILTTLLELVTGFVLEKFFNTKWWDYSNQKWNLKGYICVKFSILWGGACLLIVDIFHAFIDKLLSKLPYTLGVILIIIFSVVIIVDLICTVLQMINLKKITKEINKVSSLLQVPSEKIDVVIYNATMKNIEKSKELKKKFENSRLAKSFPNLKNKIMEKYEQLKEENKK